MEYFFLWIESVNTTVLCCPLKVEMARLLSQDIFIFWGKSLFLRPERRIMLCHFY